MKHIFYRKTRIAAMRSFRSLLAAYGIANVDEPLQDVYFAFLRIEQFYRRTFNLGPRNADLEYYRATLPVRLRRLMKLMRYELEHDGDAFAKYAEIIMP